jgi:hypothetical protein
MPPHAFLSRSGNLPRHPQLPADRGERTRSARENSLLDDGAEKITGFACIDVLGHVCAENILLHCNLNAVKCVPEVVPWQPCCIGSLFHRAGT